MAFDKHPLAAQRAFAGFPAGGHFEGESGETRTSSVQTSFKHLDITPTNRRHHHQHHPHADHIRRGSKQHGLPRRYDSPSLTPRPPAFRPEGPFGALARRPRGLHPCLESAALATESLTDRVTSLQKRWCMYELAFGLLNHSRSWHE